MPDNPGPDVPGTEETQEAAGPGGFMVYMAVFLIAILIILVVFMNMSGQGATAATAISQYSWELQSFADPDETPHPVLDGTIPTAKFSTDGKLTGSGGCNGYSSRYIVKDTLIVISPITTTKMNCGGEGVMVQESRYYALLEEAASLRIHDRVLTLYNTAGKPLLTFNAK